MDRLLDQGYSSTDICSALIQLLKGGPGPKPAPAEAKAPVEERRAEAVEIREEEPSGPAAAGRTGREEGMTTLFMDAGRKQLVTTGEIVGKITGVTRLPSDAVGAIDIRQRHCRMWPKSTPS